jgi:hypothetical protein
MSLDEVIRRAVELTRSAPPAARQVEHAAPPEQPDVYGFNRLVTERLRIAFLVRRDGIGQARAWVERTLQLYREAIASGSFAAAPWYRPLFEQSIGEFEAWLAQFNR